MYQDQGSKPLQGRICLFNFTSTQVCFTSICISDFTIIIILTINGIVNLYHKMFLH